MAVIDPIPYFDVMLKSNFVRFKKSAEWKRIYDEMAVHVNGTEPTRIVATRRPKEDNEILQYRLDNYEPITKSIVRQAINGLFRIFNEQNYQLKLSEDLETYIQKPIFYGMSFMSFIQTHVVYQMILDPNAIIVVLPSGDGVKVPTKMVNPQLYVVPSDNIIDIGYEHIMFLAEEKSVVDYYNKQIYKGDVYYLLTTDAVWKYYQTGKYTERNYKAELVYQHDLGEIPFTILGGEWNASLEVYESYFNSFIPFANEALRQYSDWQGIMVTSAYPIRIMKFVECVAKGCESGTVTDYITGHQHPCKTCGGTGRVPPSSPYGVYVREQSFLGGDNEDKTPPLEYVSPPVDIIKFSMEAWEGLLKKAEQSLHLDIIDEAQSGVAKAIDREREYAMVLKISNNIFDNIIYRCLKYIELYRNINSPILPSIIKPKEFNLKTEGHLIDDLAKLKQYGAPTGVVREVVKELIKTRYTGDIKTYYAQLFLLEYNSLYVYTAEEQISLMAAGVCTRKEVIKAIYAASILDQIMNENSIEIKKENYAKLGAEIDKRLQYYMESDEVNRTLDNQMAAKNKALSIVYTDDISEREVTE